jgi:hypothetical protein
LLADRLQHLLRSELLRVARGADTAFAEADVAPAAGVEAGLVSQPTRKSAAEATLTRTPKTRRFILGLSSEE